MAIKGYPGEHLAAARELLDRLAVVPQDLTPEAQVRATVAVAHAVLALAENVSTIRQDMRA